MTMIKYNKSAFLKLFLIITITYFSLNLIFASFSSFINRMADLFTIPYMILCVMGLNFFIKKGYNKIIFSIPLLNISFLALTFVLGTYSTFNNNLTFGLWWKILIHIIYTINILLSVYIIKKFNVI